MKCVHCGCTETTPCAGGCGWASTNPPRCDAPACLAAHARAKSIEAFMAMSAAKEPNLAVTDAARQASVAQLCQMAGCAPKDLRVSRITERVIARTTVDPTGRYALVERSYISGTAFAIEFLPAGAPSSPAQADGSGS